MGKPHFIILAGWAIIFQMLVPAFGSDFNTPWRMGKYPLVLDAYELNPLDWEEIVKNKRIVGFIGKASDGLPPTYCSDAKSHCGSQWRKYAITKELYHTRRQLAKTLGLKWGAYHLARAGNPIQQAVHFISFADPRPDEVIVLDIESLDDERFMTLEDAEIFARFLYAKIDRYPMLYANHQVSSYIAENRQDYPVLSRLKLWYARYKDDITGVFPRGNWDTYTLWQFAYGGNCNKKNCPYRVSGTPYNIDVNVAPMEVDELLKAWPFDGLLEEKPLPVEPTPDTILVSNTVEYPEEEKHSDYVIDQDYQSSGFPSLLEEFSDDIPLPVKSPIVGKLETSACDQTLAIDQMESDDLGKC